MCKINLRCQKSLGSGLKIRVGRVSGNTQFIFLGLMNTDPWQLTVVLWIIYKIFSADIRFNDIVTFILKKANLDFVAARGILVSQAHLMCENFQCKFSGLFISFNSTNS